MEANQFKYVGAWSPLEYVVRSETNQRTGKAEQWMTVRGYASDTSWDKLKGRVYPQAIVGMVRCVNDGAPTPLFRNDRAAQNPTRNSRQPVGIDVDHSMNWTDQIGYAKAARVVDEVPQELMQRGLEPEPPLFYVEFDVDLEMSHGRDLMRAIDRGDQLGLSIYGKVTDGEREWINRARGEYRDHFRQIDLHKIAVTSKPVNNNTLIEVIQRSMTGVTMEEQELQPQEGDAQEPQEAAQSDDAAETDSTETVVDSPVSEGVAPGEPDGADTAPELDPQDPSDAAAPADTEGEAVETEGEQGSAEVETPTPAPEPLSEAEVEEAARVAGLNPDAMQDIIGLGAVAPREEGAPAAQESGAETAPTEEPQETVARALPDTDTLVSAEVFRSFEDETRDTVGSLSDALAKALDRVERLEARIKKLTEVQRSMLEEPTGRRGAMIMRSLSEEDQEARKADLPLGWELDKETRERVMQELVLRGDGHIALAMSMGLLKRPQDVPSYAYKDPLLPGNHKSGQAEGLMEQSGAEDTATGE